MKKTTGSLDLAWKTLLVISFLWLFSFVYAAATKSIDLGYFSFLLNQIEQLSYFKPPEDQWLSNSLAKLSLRSPAKPITKHEYTQILKDAAAASPDKGNTLLEEALKSLVLSLPDPYAAFFNPLDADIEEVQTHGQSHPGFGLILFQRGDRVEISGTLPGSPADQAGLSPGDFVMKVNGRPAKSLQQVNDTIHPENGRPLSLALNRHGRVMKYSLEPAKIRFIPLVHKQLQKAGYIAMQVIPPGNDREFLQAAKSFESHGDPFLILDLRNCIGGEVTTAARIAGAFLNSNDVIYYQDTRIRRITYANATATRLFIPVYLLTNHATSSAAEIIAGALKDHKRAIVIGETTVGKGTVQTTWRLRNGEALRFTTAVYLTPLLKKVSDVGIAPDVVHPWKKGESPATLESLIESLGKH